MPRTTLTDISVRSAKPPETGTITLWDTVQPKLGVRINKGGVKSFIILVGSGQRQAIGRYPELSLREARAVAAKKFAEKTLGRHITPTITFADAFARFASTHCDQKNRPRTAFETKRLITRHFLPKFGQRRISEITTNDISRIIDNLLATPAEANRAFAAVRGMFTWAVRQQFLENSPCGRLQMPATPVKRDRVLTDTELAAIYSTAAKRGFPFGTIVQLLILTGQRRGEIAALRWEWISEEEGTITLPSSLTKNRRQHTFPFGPTAAALLAATPRQSGYLFPAARDKVKGHPATIFAGWGKPKAALDEALGAAGYEIAPWTLHDLRRTFATNLAAIGTPIHVTEKLLNHVSGTTGGIVAIYQRHAYMDEMREAIRKWDARLSAVITY